MSWPVCARLQLAIGILDQIGRDEQGRAEATEILTSAGATWTTNTTWPHSVLDEAIGGRLDARFDAKVVGPASSPCRHSQRPLFLIRVWQVWAVDMPAFCRA